MKLPRPVLLAAVLLLLAAGLLLLMNWDNRPAAPKEGEEEPSRSGVWLNDLRTVQVGGHPAAWIWLAGRLEDAGGRTMVVDVFARPPPRRAVLLQGPWAGAARMDEFKSQLGAALGGIGMALEEQSFSGLTAENNGRVLILPAGAWPEELMQEWKSKIGPEDIVIYLGVRQNVTLDAQGGMGEGVGVRNELLAAGRPSGFVSDGEMLAGPDGRAVWRIPHTLGEYDDLHTLADSLAQGMVSDPAARRMARQSVAWQNGARTAVVLLPQSWKEDGFARVRLVDSAGRTQALWDAPLRGLAGDVEGPAMLRMNQTAAFQIRLQPSFPQNERIRYRAALYAPNQSRFDAIDLGEETIRAGGAWVGSFTYNAWPVSGDWRIVIEDQFGRAYAEAAVHVIGYNIEIVESLGNTYRFRIIRDGVPLAGGQVRVRRAGSERWSNASLNQGVLSVTANWDDGAKKIEVEVDGSRIEYGWEQNGGGTWAAAWKWGLPGLLVAGLLYWLLRPRTRPTYRIRIGELPMIESRRVSLGMEEMKAVMEAAARRAGWNGPDAWALRAEDVMESLHQGGRGGKPVMASLESVEEAMDGLAKEGRLCRWREWFGLAGRGIGEKDIRQQSVGKMLKDRLLETGIRPKPMHSSGPHHTLVGYCDELGRQWMVFAPDEWRGRVMKGRLPHCIVFADRAEREDFRRELAREPGGPIDRLRLGIRTGRVKLMTVKEMAS